MRQEYLDELEQLKVRMEKAERFAAALPVFAEQILQDKITGEEEWMRFGDRYKKIRLSWGINRGHYRNGGRRTITNYTGEEYSCHLFNIYINTCDLFDGHEKFDLYEYLAKVNIFFADRLNTTFYVTDDNIHPFLEALNTWYCDAAENLKLRRLQEQEAELKKRLEETREQLQRGAA